MFSPLNLETGGDGRHPMTLYDQQQIVLAGMICGGAMVFIWKFLVRPLGGGWDIYELLPAFIVALAAIVVVSLITPAPEQKVLDGFDEYQRAIAK